MYVPGIKLKDYITIDKVHSLHYFEFSSKYSFPGEYHDFWEMIYVDKGRVEIQAEERRIILESGSVYFHPPGQWHTLRACEGIASNIAVFTFSCSSDAICAFEDACILVTPFEKQLISNIIAESELAFSTALDAPYINRLRARKDAPPGAQQLVKIYLTQLLIFLSRRLLGYRTDPGSDPREEGVFGEIVDYMKSKLSMKLTLDTIARDFGMSVSSVKNIFQRKTGSGAIDYFIRLKIDRAKELLRTRLYNVTQISSMLGYDSIYSFSAQFKKFSGMSPTEYLFSIQSLENPL